MARQRMSKSQKATLRAQVQKCLVMVTLLVPWERIQILQTCQNPFSCDCLMDPF